LASYACGVDLLRRRERRAESQTKGVAILVENTAYQAIVIELSFASHGDEASFGQDFEMLRAGRLRNRKALGEFAAAALSRPSYRLQDAETRGIRKGFGDFDNLMLVHICLH
jgi:hypothetical protein